MEEQNNISDSGLDRSVLDQLYLLGQGSGALVCSVIDAFRRAIPGYLQELQNGVAEGDAEAVRMASHAIKSSAANLGAIEFAAKCQVMEHQARDGEITTSAEDLAVVESMLPALMASLDQEYTVASAKNAA